MKCQVVSLIFSVSVAAALAAPPKIFRDGFILGSRVNIRTTPDISAKSITVLPIGTPVRWKPASAEWCEIALPTGIAAPGFLLCSLVTDKKPTLESIDSELTKPGLTSAQENDLLARRFYLSPSLKTLGLMRTRKKMVAMDYLPARPDPQPQPANVSAVDYAFFASLMEAFRGELMGQDFRPVDMRINETAVKNLSALMQNSQNNNNDNAGSIALESPTSPLPAAQPSLFRHPNDVLVPGWVGKNRYGAQDSEPVNQDLSVMATADHWESVDMIEFSKLYPGQRLNVRQLDPLYSRNDDTGSAWHKAGGVVATFAVPPQAIVISRNRAIPAKVKSAEVRLAQTDCGSWAQGVSAEMSRPMFSATGLMVVLAPHIQISEIKRIGDATNPAVFDLNGDGIPDLAYVVHSVGDQISESLQSMSVLVNINGMWRLALTNTDEYCP